MSDIRVLGIDASMTATGWGLVGAGGELLRRGVVRGPDSSKSGYRARIAAIAVTLGRIVDGLAQDGLTPTHVVVEEGLVYGARVATLRLLQVNGGIGVLVFLAAPQAEFLDLEVREWRAAVEFSFTHRKGEDSEERTRRLKAELIVHAETLWKGLKFDTADEAEGAMQALRGYWHFAGIKPIVPKPKKPRKKKDGMVMTSRGQRSRRQPKVKGVPSEVA